MDDKSGKVTAAGSVQSFIRPVIEGQPSARGAPVVERPGAPVLSPATVNRLMFGSESSGAFVESSAHQGSIEFATGSGSGYGPRFDIPGPMMRTVRDPSLSLQALSGVDPEGAVMVEIPPVADAGHLKTLSVLAGSRIGFASEYIDADSYIPIEHSAHFARVLSVLQATGVQLVAVQALRVDESCYFSLEQGNEIDDRVHENRLDMLVSDAHSAAFHRGATERNPKRCLPTGTDSDGTETAVWCYGAHGCDDRLKVLVQEFQRVLQQEGQALGLPTSRG